MHFTVWLCDLHRLHTGKLHTGLTGACVDCVLSPT
jgi:hypothetical protein